MDGWGADLTTRPMAWVRHAWYSWSEFTRSGCTKNAWLAVVRLAPEALSSLTFRSRTLGSP